jgi:hypothetical protein
MTVICRLLRLTEPTAAQLAAAPASLPQAVASSKKYSDVYRYWDAISFLLARHAAASPAATWRTLGTDISAVDDGLPGAHLIPAADVRALAAALAPIEPDALAPHYDAAALDAAAVYPGCWARWEETFDPLGQVLEHYHFLRLSTAGAAKASEALLLVYEDDGDDPCPADED